ncbi:hypothetical protein SeMB42_g07283 [Synchytrium endobioticum]|uniref:Uncharacterized protein n=1 Tax=Synchytrium endobioticum TaxID=286115 RepID=A0A507CGZ6_9FUNG|nr:hypothetical protein SeMB42_g07283 [Synchytrium endobioticum]TPX37264.1 hypothetical protein SeLEV6574_g07948 [Synchytrium endobioticum]
MQRTIPVISCRVRIGSRARRPPGGSTPHRPYSSDASIPVPKSAHGRFPRILPRDYVESTVHSVVAKYVAPFAPTDPWKSIFFSSSDLPFKNRILQDAIHSFKRPIPNSHLGKIETVQDLIEFYCEDPVKRDLWNPYKGIDSVEVLFERRRHEIPKNVYLVKGARRIGGEADSSVVCATGETGAAAAAGNTRDSDDSGQA